MVFQGGGTSSFEKRCELNTRAALITAALITLTLGAALVFTGCPNSAGGSGAGGSTTPPASADKTYTVGGVSFTMKKIAAVKNKTVGHNDNSTNPLHTVSLSAYFIGETEVTQELWQAVMGTNPSEFQGAGKEPASGETQEKRPVESVSWYDCIVFCNELTKKVNGDSDSECVYTVGGHTYSTTDAAAKKVPVMKMNKKGFRLPTEAEWEWAAKGGTEDRWAGTDEEDKLGEYAWYKKNSEDKSHEVKKKLPNGYGLYDMSGNVWEWCWDGCWAPGALPDPLPEDYAGDAFGPNRIMRSGSWYNEVRSVNRVWRSWSYPTNGSSQRGVGLRLACRP
ncbi:MAG: formylglycine-generating enzyme family protein [Treponema lecithinolyticum]|uniref:formylglycine-generating enzyme family protein n=1 Tax=Treponema lecithinolyticum TaxID=53418 RepID=UPI0036205B43